MTSFLRSCAFDSVLLCVAVDGGCRLKLSVNCCPSGRFNEVWFRFDFNEVWP